LIATVRYSSRQEVIVTASPLPISIPTPLQISGHVSGGLEPWTIIFEAILAAATIALAVYTARLFGKTAELANDTAAAALLTDRHHQESLRPIIEILEASVIYSERVLTGHLLKDRKTNQNGSKVALDSGDVVLARVAYFIRVKNIGAAPALSVQATFAVDGFETESFLIGSLAANDTAEIQELKKSQHKEETRIDTPLVFDLAVSYANVFLSFGMSSRTYDPKPGPITYATPIYVPRDIGFPAQRSRTKDH